MATARKIDDEFEARRCLQAAKRAGQSAGEWARAHGIDGRSLHAWKINVERGRPRATPGADPAAGTLAENGYMLAGGASLTVRLDRVAQRRIHWQAAANTPTLGDRSATPGCAASGFVS